MKTVHFINIIDVTGSMGGFIHTAKRDLLNLMDRFDRQFRQYAPLTYSLIVYRDHPPQDSTFASKILCNSVGFPLFASTIRSDTRDLRATGGGDTPESGLDAIMDIKKLKNIKQSLLYCFLWGDAQFHGTPITKKQSNVKPCKCGLTYKDVNRFKEEIGVKIISFPLLQNTILLNSFASISDVVVRGSGYVKAFEKTLGSLLKFFHVAEEIEPIIKEEPRISLTELQERTDYGKKEILPAISLLTKLNKCKPLQNVEKIAI